MVLVSFHKHMHRRVRLIVLVSFHKHMYRGVGLIVLVSFHKQMHRRLGLMVLVSFHKQMHTQPTLNRARITIDFVWKRNLQLGRNWSYSFCISRWKAKSKESFFRLILFPFCFFLLLHLWTLLIEFLWYQNAFNASYASPSWQLSRFKTVKTGKPCHVCT